MTSKKNNEHIEPEQNQDTQPVATKDETAESKETEPKLDAPASNKTHHEQLQADHKEQIEKDFIGYHYSYSKKLANFEVFRYFIFPSKNLLFLKS